MTTPEQKAVFRHLTKRVALDKDTVTYRMLSREQGITVCDAKKYLETFLSEPSAVDRGVSAVWLLSGLLSSSAPPTNGSSAKANGHDGMDVDGEAKPAEETIMRRNVMLATAAELEDKLALFSQPPSKHVYALTPLVITDLTLLASCALYAAPESAIAKWKPAPKDGYGGITHPDGEQKKKRTTAKGKPVASTSTKAAVSTSKPVSKDEPEDKKPATSTAKGKGKETVATKSASGKPAPRAIGQLGGLFAKRDPPPAKVPTKRKASPPPPSKKKSSPAKSAPKKAGKANGIFGDEELASDEDMDDTWDEEVMREAEEEAERQALEKSKSKTGASTGTSAAAAGQRDKEKKDLEAMFLEDDEDAMEIEDVKPTKKIVANSASTNKAPAKPAAAKSSGSSAAAKPKASGNLKSFFKKA